MAKNVALWRTKQGKDGRLYWEGFPPFDGEAAARELPPERRGADYAVQTPSHNQPDLTTEEKDLLKSVNDHITRLQDWHLRVAGEIEKEVNAIGNPVDAPHFFSEISYRFAGEARRIATDFEHEQKVLLDHHERARKALEAFKLEHGLRQRHQAYYTDSPYLHFALLFGAVVVEGIANAAFFPQDLGLLGGFFIAVLVSLANVSICFVAGWLCLPQLNHKSMVRKVLGLLGFLVIAALVLSLHFAVAHYREVLARNPDAELLTSLAFDPRTLQDMESLLLIAIGSAISVFAIWKGYTFDDPYPGFGRVFRTWKDLDERVSDARRTFKQSINASHDKLVSEVQSLPLKLSEKEKELKTLEGEIGTHFACVDSYYSQARQGGISLITSFRRAVQSVWPDPSLLPLHAGLLDGHLVPLDPREVEKTVREGIHARLALLQQSRQTYAERKDEELAKLEKQCEKWKRDPQPQSAPRTEPGIGTAEETWAAPS